MLLLAREYEAAPPADRSALLAAGEVLVAAWLGTAFLTYYILNGIALLLVGIALLRTRALGRSVAWWAVVAGILMLVPSTFGVLGLVMPILSLLPRCVMCVLLSRRLNALAASPIDSGNERRAGVREPGIRTRRCARGSRACCPGSERGLAAPPPAPRGVESPLHRGQYDRIEYAMSSNGFRRPILRHGGGGRRPQRSYSCRQDVDIGSPRRAVAGLGSVSISWPGTLRQDLGRQSAMSRRRSREQRRQAQRARSRSHLGRTQRRWAW